MEIAIWGDLCFVYLEESKFRKSDPFAEKATILLFDNVQIRLQIPKGNKIDINKKIIERIFIYLFLEKKNDKIKFDN